MRKNIKNRHMQLLIAIIFGMIVQNCIISDECEAYVNGADLYIKLAIENESRRIYISRTDSFGSDYIQFNFTQVTAPRIYYIEPDSLYIIDKDSFYVTEMKCQQFKIKYINHIYPPDLTMPCDSATFNNFHRTVNNIERIDSIIYAKRSYTISIDDNALGITIFNPEGKIITETSLLHKLF